MSDPYAEHIARLAGLHVADEEPPAAKAVELPSSPDVGRLGLGPLDPEGDGWR